MIVIPAIDLSEGACVRLYQGDFAEKTVYSKEPLDTAKRFAEEGASWLHVVDLDGAREGKMAQTAAISLLARESGLRVQVGGGVRTDEQIEGLLEAGVHRVVLGSVAVDVPERVGEWLAQFGPERLVLAFDVRVKDGQPFPATRGWQDDDARSLWAVLEHYRNAPLRHVLCTDIARDGTLEGPNLELYRELQEKQPEVELIASGGVSNLDDLRALASMGIPATVVGKALYEGRFTVKEAIEC